MALTLSCTAAMIAAGGMSSIAAVKLPRFETPTLTAIPRADKPAHRISRSELTFLITFTFVLALLTSIPHLVATVGHFQGTTFSGYLSHSLDSNNYSAYINQAAQGGWLFRNPMTPEPHSPVFFNLEWLVGGKIAAFFHLSLPNAIDIERVLSLILMCLSIYWLAADLFSAALVRQLALVAFVSGGGFGWITALHAFHIPVDSSYFLDLSNGNLFPFYWALKLPHFLVSESLLTLGMAAYLEAERAHQRIYYVASGLSFAAAGSCRPYDMLFIMAATVLYVLTAIPTQPGLRVTVLRLMPATFCLPLLAYYAWIFKFHPIFKWWSLPGKPAPAAWLLAIAFGPSFLFFLWALTKLPRCIQDSRCKFLLSCLCTAVLFSYAHRWLHFAFQFATNIFLPMLLLSFLALESSVLLWKNKFRWSGNLIAFVLFVNGLSSLALTAQATFLAAKGDFRISTPLVDSFHWLDAHSAAGEPVLADFDNASLIPQYTHNVVFCGYINAVDFDEKFRELNDFFRAGTPESSRLSLLRAFHIHYVFVTHQEEQSLPEFMYDPQVRSLFRNEAGTILAMESGARPIN